jgi:hypothetical protein
MAVYVAAAGALIAMYGQYQAGQDKATQGRYMADLTLAQGSYMDYLSGLEADNAIWQSEWAAALQGEKAGQARAEANLTLAQAGEMVSVATDKRNLSEADIALKESQSFDTLASNVSTKKASFGKSGVRVGTGSPESFLSSYWDKKSNEINTASSISRGAADLEQSTALFGADVLKTKGTIQLDQASLMDSQVGYILQSGQYDAGMIRNKAGYNSNLARAQAAIYRAGAGQALTAGWLNAAGTGTSAAYNILK